MGGWVLQIWGRSCCYELPFGAASFPLGVTIWSSQDRGKLPCTLPPTGVVDMDFYSHRLTFPPGRGVDQSLSDRSQKGNHTAILPPPPPTCRGPDPAVRSWTAGVFTTAARIDPSHVRDYKGRGWIPCVLNLSELLIIYPRAALSHST